MRARYAALRVDALAKMRELLAVTPTLSAPELAPLLGLQTATVRLYAHEAGITLTPGKKGPKPGSVVNRGPVSAETLRLRGEAIAARAAEKRAALMEKVRAERQAAPLATHAELAAKLNVSRQHVARLLKVLGFENPSRGGDVQAAVEAYRNGMTREEAAIAHGVGQARLRRAMAEAGIAARPRGRRQGVKLKAREVPVPLDQQRDPGRWHTAKLRLVRIADGVMLASTNSPETALRLAAFFGPGVEMRRAA